MVIDPESDKLIENALIRSVTDLERCYCRNVNCNREYADSLAVCVANYLKVLRKFIPTFELVTGSDSLIEFLRKEVYDV